MNLLLNERTVLVFVIYLLTIYEFSEKNCNFEHS